MKNMLLLFALPDVKKYYKPTVNKMVYNWCKDRQIYQWNIESPERNS